MLDLPTPFVGTCWGHAMSKVTQYATNDNKVCGGLVREASLKLSQSKLQTTIMWTKKLGRGGKEWREACMDVQF